MYVLDETTATSAIEYVTSLFEYNILRNSHINSNTFQIQNMMRVVSFNGLDQ